MFRAPGSICTKPSDELLMHDPTHLFSGSAASKPRENRAQLWIVLIRVGLKVNADGIMAKQERLRFVVKPSVSCPQSATLLKALFRCLGHVTPSNKRISDRRQLAKV